MFITRWSLMAFLLGARLLAADAFTPSWPKDIARLGRFSVTRELSNLLVKKMGRETLATLTPQSERAILLRLNPPISCKDLIHGTLQAPSDGKASSICDYARDRCLEYDALRFLWKQGKSPFTKQQTRVFLAKLRAKAIRGRATCFAIKKAVKHKAFLEEIFDARETARLDFSERP